MIWNMAADRRGLLVTVLLAALLGWTQSGQAQVNQFGGQDRADAARQMIVLGVQQGIDSLPPVSGQGFSYEFDPASDEYVRSTRLGPTAFRSPQPLGAGKLSVRLATSYFELADSLGPIPYRVQTDEPLPGQTQPFLGVAKFGLNASAKVGLINLAATYGFTNRFEMTASFPIVIVDAHAAQVFSSTRAGLGLPADQAKVFAIPIVNNDVAGALRKFDQALKPGGVAVLRTESLSEQGFNGGTQAGLGRIDIGAKAVLYSGKRVQVAAAPEFFFPSPNQAEFAGSDSAAILPRLVAACALGGPFKLHVDSGYNLDFDHDELRSFVWNVGTSIAGSAVAVDAGVGGSKFNQGITWTPAVAKGIRTQVFPSSTITALGDNTLGDNFVNFLGGCKVRVMDDSAVSGAVSVPLNNQGFRADAIGTVAFEHYF